MGEAAAREWEIDQDDYGQPVVRHRHPTGSITAYVIGGSRTGARFAVCADCREVYRLKEGNPRRRRRT
jgi:quercetin dioxygenase-like cupin family protein